MRTKPTIRTTTFPLLVMLCLFPASLFAHCPIPANGTLEVDAQVGNLIIDTSGTDGVDWDVSSKQIVGTETCSKDMVRIVGTASEAVKSIPDWHIKVPRTIILDLVTKAGSITIGHLDNRVNLRTGGGDVVIGNVRGETSIVTQAGNIQVGDIGSNADIKSTGAGNLALGNVSGEVSIWTLAGDITIGSAQRIVSAVTGGGNMLIRRVFGSVSAKNEAGDIRIEQAGSWVEASTGSGNIYLRMVPDRTTGDLHVNLKAGTGDITLFMPSSMKADVQATGTGSQVKADFPLINTAMRGNGIQGLIPTPSNRPGPTVASSFAITQTGQRNGGGNVIKLHTANGRIDIKLFN